VFPALEEHCRVTFLTMTCYDFGPMSRRAPNRAEARNETGTSPRGEATVYELPKPCAGPDVLAAEPAWRSASRVRDRATVGRLTWLLEQLVSGQGGNGRGPFAAPHRPGAPQRTVRRSRLAWRPGRRTAQAKRRLAPRLPGGVPVRERPDDGPPPR